MPNLNPSPVRTGYAFRDALRLLFILVRGGVRNSGGDQDWDSVFVGEKRALAIDFWIRYPDYLADELLDQFESGARPGGLQDAKDIFDGEEPDLRQIKMIRWRRGAYDDLQTSLGILTFRGLIKSMDRALPNGMAQHEYLSGPHARRFLAEAVDDHPSLGWYEKQTGLALAVAKGQSGSALKDIHYRDPEYGSTPFGATIPSIRDRVSARLAKLLETNNVS